MEHALGTSELERRRLETQAVFFSDFTRRTLKKIGLHAGMHVLDVGSGSGDVTLLAAEIVGLSGQVTGIDVERRMVEHARSRAQSANVANVRFQVSSLESDGLIGNFDVVVGRLVAAFQKDKVDFIRRAASLAKTGGTVAFVEPGWNMTTAWTDPVIPSYDGLLGEYLHALEAMDVDPYLGSSLASSFVEAGLGEPLLSAEFLVGTHASGLPDFVLTNFEVAFNQARLRGLHVPTAKEFKVKSEEVRRTAKAKNVQFNGPCIVAAWAKID